MVYIITKYHTMYGVFARFAHMIIKMVSTFACQLAYGTVLYT